MVLFVVFLLPRESPVVVRLLGLQPFQGSPEFLELLPQGIVFPLRFYDQLSQPEGCRFVNCVPRDLPFNDSIAFLSA